MHKRLYKLNVNNQGLTMKIKKYINSDNILIVFDDGTEVKSSYSNFKNKQVKNKNHPTVHGVGYIGYGKYKPCNIKTENKSYTVWRSMIGRCYSKRKKLAYSDNYVCDEWLCFQNFAEWFDDNYYEIDSESIEMDKDILVKNNKVYSPEFCTFIPKFINTVLTNRRNYRGDYLPGVHVRKDTGKYVSSLNKYGKRFRVGEFGNEDDAFAAYKKEKEKYIYEAANQYKNKIPKNVYNALLLYRVNEND